MRIARGAMKLGLVAILAAGLTACGTTGPMAANQDGGGLKLFGGGQPQAKAASEIGVNSYLWRAALDVVKFMPLASADPYGGVVITDWYADPAKPDERFKVTVYILDTRLRADGLNVAVFKQVASDGVWVDAPASAQTEIDMENTILDRARKLRLANVTE